MKTTRKSRVYLPVAALILAATLAIPAAAQQQVPFKGAFQGKDTVNPTTITTSGTGIGDADGSILIDPRDFLDHLQRVCSLGGGQRGQHQFDIPIIGRR